ncbi:MAG: TIGR00295 family protein [Euryarchaeota archaeon]|nr:TIGR00295 family protein [Euryarchaeota archaeon]
MPTVEEALEILRRCRVPERVVEHSLAVAELATELASRAKVPLDLELVRAGALLHDLGRARTHGIRHAVEGAKLARALGLDGRLVRIIERHIGAGIPREEAAKLGLPPGDYTPRTREEKLVAYADNLVLGTRRLSFEESLERFRRVLGEGHPSLKRMEELHREVTSWLEAQPM